MSMNHAPSLARLRSYERTSHMDAFAVLEAILFVVVMALLVAALAAGVMSYSRISNARTDDDAARVATSVVANSVRHADAVDAVRAGNGPEGPALVLVEASDAGAYETRIYQYRGMLVEEYALAGSAYIPARATQLVANSVFSFVYEPTEGGGLLEVTTDAGTTSIALHAQGGQGSATGEAAPAGGSQAEAVQPASNRASSSQSAQAGGSAAASGASGAANEEAKS